MSDFQNQHTPPKRALQFLRWYCSTNRLEEIEGDLEEVFFNRLETMSYKKAKRLFWWDVIRCCRPYAWKQNFEVRPTTSVIMFKNYLTVAKRQLLKSKLNSAINVVGLAMGISICLLVSLYVHDDLFFDNFHEKGERIYHLSYWSQDEDGERRLPITSYLMLPAFKEELSWIENGTRYFSRSIFVKDNHNEVVREKLHFVDNAFFEIFDFPLLYGNKEELLKNPYSIVIDESTALRITGKANPLGETIDIKYFDETYQFEITGIMKKFPTNSSIRLNFAVSTKFLESATKRGTLLTNWNELSFNTFLLAKENVSQAEMEESLNKIHQRNSPDEEGEKSGLSTTPFSELHLSEKLYGLSSVADIGLSYKLSAIGFFILLMACINYTNISVGTSLPRATEVGIRRAIGANKSDLFKQLMFETAFNTLISFGMAFVILIGVIPVFSSLTGKVLVWQSIFRWEIGLVSLGIYCMIILLAGSYPALVIARFQVMKALKGKQKLSGKQYFGKALLVIQFAIAIFFIGSLVFVNEQISFLSKKDLGYEPKGVLTLQVSYGEDIATITEKLKIAFADKGIVSEIGKNGGFGNSTIMELNNREVWVTHERVDDTILDVFGIQLKTGRILSEENIADQTKNVIVNEAFVKAAGWQENEAIGQYILYENYEDMGEVSVVGVVKNFFPHSLHADVEPLLMHINPAGNGSQINLKVVEGKEMEAIEMIEEVWKESVVMTPLSYFFEEDRIKQAYQKEERLITLVSYTSAIAIIISLIGLFGIVGVAINQRTKEMGVRKVLGATYLSIYQMLSTNFMVIIGIAFLVSIPITWYAIEQWLQNFAYRIPIEVMPFILTALIILGLSAFTIIIRLYKTLRKNPVYALRDE